MKSSFILKGLYAITDEHLLPPNQLVAKVDAALAGGTQVLQYRNKQGSPSLRLQQALALKKLCHHYHVPLIINDDIKLAHTIGADGVHLGQSDIAIAQARHTLGNQAIIGATCHGSMELAKQAVSQSADYVAFGRFFTSKTKPEAPTASLNMLANIHTLDTPSVAIGGVTIDNASQLIAQGISMVAVIHDLFTAADVFAQAARFKSLF
ncbi:thiamine phosphate synthase [Zooshikella ganghwensis]|uniref:Thiamine-phosphate synthase n=1 Tax=Zooshikella ganghwensis TaxID=202772 RepID=A0A4P9VHJ8_9GAMM|nr:thiamine phosphate synthase [Zooshikella ganghwensis]RDH42645.1 thiamine phosphate synthase [Zooshikella ganghwensis]